MTAAVRRRGGLLTPERGRLGAQPVPGYRRAMNVDDFDFELPEALIALRPVSPRDSARLLVVRGREGVLEDRRISDLPELLSRGDMLVANDSRVIRAALSATRPSRTPGQADLSIHLNLNRRLAADRWSAFARPARRLRTGDVLSFAGGLSARVASEPDAGQVNLVFDRAGPALDAAIDVAGVAPLPPYIALKRAPDARDDSDYQTVFASEAGSVAAPTAGLHFTPQLLHALEACGIGRREVTLHVNAGTFLPVSVERVEDHRMHPEHATVMADTAAAINAARQGGGRCIPIGTTALRTLESAADDGGVRAFSAETSIFITPGYRFRAVDGLLTNFHLPKSTLFMLVCALMGVDVMKRAYAHAVAQQYRFFSYGDACLLLPAKSG